MPDDNTSGPPGEADCWAAYDHVVRRAAALEEIAERMAATCADPVAVADFWLWKAGR